MSPTAVFDASAHSVPANIADLKADYGIKNLNGFDAKLVQGHVEVQHAKPSLDDNYMYDFKFNHPLPLLSTLGTDIGDIDPKEVADELLVKLQDTLGHEDASGFADLFIESGRSAVRRF